MRVCDSCKTTLEATGASSFWQYKAGWEDTLYKLRTMELCLRCRNIVDNKVMEIFDKAERASNIVKYSKKEEATDTRQSAS